MRTSRFDQMLLLFLTIIQQGAFFSSEVELSSPTSERIETLSVGGTLERIAAMLGSPSNTVNASGRYVWGPRRL